MFNRSHDKDDPVTLKINGVDYTVPPDLPLETTLNLFLVNHANLRDTKTMCREGGCGSCIVSARYRHASTGKIVSSAVNSCLTFVYSCNGWEITTVSGLGNKKSGYHTLQTTLAKFNGSQCGYCSPGMVMNMHSLMEANENLTMAEIENSFGGNICRCTGYRPILDAFKSLATDAEWSMLNKIQDIEDIDKKKPCPKTGLDCSGICAENIKKTIKYEVNDIIWHKVSSIINVLRLLRLNRGVPLMLIAGNTSQGVYRPKVTPHVYIDINNIPELKQCSVDKNIILGANLTISEAMSFLTEVSGMEEFKYVQEIVDHLDLVANVPVRNMGTLAGNLSIKHQHREFPSDLFVIFEAAGAFIKIVSTLASESMVTLADFLNLDMKNKIMVNIYLPPRTGNFAFKTYKIMPRAQNSHAYVNAGFLVEFDNSTGNVANATIVYGGINSSFIHASKTENFLQNVNIFDNKVLRSALDCLSSELHPDWELPDASPDYRKSLAISLFYKFVLNMCPEKLLSEKNKSGREILRRNLSRGEQTFESKKEMWPVQEPIPKIEALYQCAGEAEYIAYIPLKPGELFAVFVLAKKPLTTITHIDAKDALILPGVKAFYSAKDIPGENSFASPKMLLMNDPEEVFCESVVKFYGQPVGVVVAESQALAEHAAKLVHIEYAPTTNGKKAYYDVRDVLAHDNTPSRVKLEDSHEAKDKGSDVAHEFSGSMDMNGQYHFTMETQTVICVPTEDGMDVYPSSQGPDNIQIAISQVIKMKEHKINVKTRRAGGAFGSKISRNNQVSAACAVAAFLLNTPVRMVLSIEDNMYAIGKRNCTSLDYQVAVNNQGVIQYLSASIYEDLGCSWNESVVLFATEMFQNCYDNVRFNLEGYAVLTEKPSTTWMRAPGATEGVAMIENIMEHIAHVTGRDPLDIRIENMRKTDNLVYDIIDDFRKKTDYDRRRHEINEFNAKNRWRKRGIAIVPMYFPIIYYGRLQAMVCIFHGDGTVAVSHSGIECGQGINTKVAQVCAYTLGVELDLVSIKPNSNMESPNSMITGGSVTSESCCLATIEACKILLERLKPIKEKLGGNPKWTDLIDEAHKEMVELQAVYSHKPDVVNKSYDVAGLSACEVEVDLLTGNVLLQRVDIREETGESISPEIDVGQVEGAFVMALGHWLTEKLIYDKTTGELKTNRTWNYKPPGAKDIPVDFRVEFTTNKKNPKGVLRSKATGEPPATMGFVAVCAIRHALQSARTDANGGKTDKWFPLGAPTTPEDILLHANIDYQKFTI
ncbi:xanthine dehydrogenase-like [Ctenocephalides felis]|uniref:xanthine dehydrogenase-like n=1 Tax=Ctenocephalides felis TaxID=7515 RepID=UPI000E6E535C|nr:xanthine dehydrogenase-like [Ctenocephalides felis]